MISILLLAKTYTIMYQLDEDPFKGVFLPFYA